jgi:hypothetical protein
MATLITVGNNNGERRCDEKCYGASGGVCTCVCGGMNHGKGLKAAQQNTIEYGKELLKKIKKENPGMKANIEAIQQNLEF